MPCHRQLAHPRQLLLVYRETGNDRSRHSNHRLRATTSTSSIVTQKTDQPIVTHLRNDALRRVSEGVVAGGSHGVAVIDN
jgi:hypothetical protein